MEIKKNLKSLFTEHWKYLALSTACKLHLFDHLKEPQSAKQLAINLSLNEEKLFLLLNFLHINNFLEKKENLFMNNSISELLTENHPESLKYACINWSDEHLTSWQHLDFSIKTGKSSFENIYGLSFFDYLNEHPEKLHKYHKAMYQYAIDDYRNLPDLIDLSFHKSVMDVGGGYGAILEILKYRYTDIEFILFDLEKVVVNVNTKEIKILSGNFFDKIPQVSDAIILARVIHDWDDYKAGIILHNCFEALPKGGKLYIIENCIDKIKNDLSLLSLNMTAICNSVERTSNQYISLAQKEGFLFINDLKLNELQTILIFKK